MTENKTSFLQAAYKFSDSVAPEEIKAHYDAWAENYDEELVDKHSYIMPIRAAAAITTHCENRSARIIDIGCGTGLSGKALRDNGFTDLDGCDLSPGMLAKAAERNIYGRLFEADLTKPPLDADDASYDVMTVVGAFSFGHIPVKAMDDLLRVVKPGGLFLITTNDHYYDEGTIQPKLDQLVDDKIVSLLLSDHGAHIEGLNVGGWVFLMRKL